LGGIAINVVSGTSYNVDGTYCWCLLREGVARSGGQPMLKESFRLPVK